MKAEWTNRDNLSIETTGRNSKSILVIDTPDICYKRPCYDHEGGICQASHNWKTDRENGCELRPLPLKGTMENVVDCEYNRGFVDGRNHCIDLIVGETE